MYVQALRPVDELVQALLQLLDLEPVGVEGHHVRRTVLLVSAVKVLLQPLEHLVGVVVVQHALVQVRAVASLVRLDVVGVQWHLPDACRRKSNPGSDKRPKMPHEAHAVHRTWHLPGKDLVGQVPDLHSWGIL